MAQENRQSGGWTLKPLTVEVGEVAIVLGTPDGVPGGRGGAWRGEGSNLMGRAMDCRSMFQVLRLCPRRLRILHEPALL